MAQRRRRNPALGVPILEVWGLSTKGKNLLSGVTLTSRSQLQGSTEAKIRELGLPESDIYILRMRMGKAWAIGKVHYAQPTYQYQNVTDKSLFLTGLRITIPPRDSFWVTAGKAEDPDIIEAVNNGRLLMVDDVDVKPNPKDTGVLPDFPTLRNALDVSGEGWDDRLKGLKVLCKDNDFGELLFYTLTSKKVTVEADWSNRLYKVRFENDDGLDTEMTITQDQLTKYPQFWQELFKSQPKPEEDDENEDSSMSIAWRGKREELQQMVDEESVDTNIGPALARMRSKRKLSQEL